MNYLKRFLLFLALTLFPVIALSAAGDAADKDASILLEEAIYTEEIIGDYDEAARIYRQIADNAESGRGAAAQALYRLGRYYEGRERAAEAKAAFERVVKQYPEQKELISRIPDLSDTHQNFPQLLPAPWEDGEMLTYSGIKNITVVHKTTETVTIEPINEARTFISESVSINGKKSWKIFSADATGNSMGYRTIFAADDTFVPVETRHMRGFNLSLAVEYFSDRLVVRSELGNLTNSNEHQFSTAVYDSEQIVYLLRRLPLQMGFETTIPLYGSSGLTNQRISVVSREHVTTPAGTFNAWVVALGNKGAEYNFHWISDDNRRYPVKMAASRTDEKFFELISISKNEKNKRVEYGDQDISFSLPPGWFSLNTNDPPAFSEITRRRYICIGDPEPETYSDFTITEYPSGMDAKSRLSKYIDTLISGNKSRYKYYLVRSGNMENITVSGFPGVRFSVDHSDGTGNKNIALYTYVIATEDKVIQADFRPLNNNSRFKPIFDSIIESIQLK
jgi:tetratricopeptide (TPR) repeat protein